MAYKTILVHLDDSKHADQRIEVAANLAVSHGAYLIGAAMAGVPKSLDQTFDVRPGGVDMSSYLDAVWQHAHHALARFEALAGKKGVMPVAKRLIDDEAPDGVCSQSHFCDLVVLGQYDPDDNPGLITADLAEYVAMQGGTPVLIVPCVGHAKTVGERVLIAWNASAEATRAMRAAVPLLAQAKVVTVALFRPSSQPDSDMTTIAVDLGAYLARHGIKAEVIRQTYDPKDQDDIGILLLSLASDLASDLLVMGCYGHFRLREILLGGATRTVLKSMKIPVLMAH